VVGRVFIDFGRNRVYALPEDDEDVIIFGGFLEMFGRLRPTIVVAHSYPRKLLICSSRSILLLWSSRLGL
jgi:hypothetical protein